MTMTLVERLCAAEGPDGDLDIEIYKLFGLGNLSPETVMEYRLDHNGEAIWRCKHAGQDWGSWWHTERYTASIDDALTLIPSGWTRDVDATAPECGIDVTLHAPGKPARIQTGTHSTEPIATCIASLRARESA